PYFSATPCRASSGRAGAWVSPSAARRPMRAMKLVRPRRLAGARPCTPYFARTEHLELDHVDAGQSYLGRDNRRASEVVSNILLDVDILADGRHAIDRHDHIKTTQRRSA